jgi:hypothetical protein
MNAVSMEPSQGMVETSTAHRDVTTHRCMTSAHEHGVNGALGMVETSTTHRDVTTPIGLQVGAPQL